MLHREPRRVDCTSLAMETATINASFPSNIHTAKERKPYGDPITKYDVDTVVKRALGSTVKVIAHQIRIYSKEKVGFMGAHRHLVATVQREGTSDPEVHTFFLKAIPFDIEEQVQAIEDSRFFFKETNFYKYVASELTISTKDQTWMAQCYLVKDSVLVFEDLKSKNFTIKDKILDVPALKSALTALAKLHASSILAEKRLGKSFLVLHPEIMRESMFVRQGKFVEWFASGVEVIAAVAKNIGLDHNSVPEVCERIFSIMSASKKWRNVICHGDAWSYNLMFDESKPRPNCVLVDFQLLRYAPATVDVAQLLYLTTRRQFREKHEGELLRFYHEVKCETLREADMDVEVPTIEETLKEYAETRIAGAITACLYYPVMLVEGNLCAELTMDSEGFANLLFRDRVDLITSIMEKDAEYKERIIEAVTELVQVYK